jgi:TolB-like protein/lipoprotein NlpI
MLLTSGARLGSYEIVDPLGAGGMGEVYRARDARLGRDVAVKVLPADVGSSPDRLARFEREARTVAALNHPNIVVLYSIEEDAGTRFLTMELVEGRNLAALVTPGGLPMGQVLDLALPLADALTAAHEKGVVHRDLKPANVMVTREGRVKVLDFGLAKLAGPAAELLHTQAETLASPISIVGEVMGTAPYMAPEQIRGETVDARADLFAFGVLLYELVAGRRPFAGHTLADVSAAILRDRPAPLARLRADLPADLERIVERCLEKNPRDRFQTALDIANELRALRRSLELGLPLAPRPASVKVASVAVLPFANRSGSADDEYFSDGLADELLGVLAKVRGLRVAARMSAFHFKGKDTTIAEVGHALNVATVLEGSVRKAGNRVRISVQLVKVSDGDHLWSEQYDRTLDDLFAVQDEIAQSVARELRTALLGEQADVGASGEMQADLARAAKGRTTNVEAYRLFLHGRHLIARRTRADNAKGIEYLKQALALDPDFALAWSDLGVACSREALLNWGPREECVRQTREALARALELEPELADGHAAMASVRMDYDWDWRGAEASARRALELAPGNPYVLRIAGVLAVNQDRFEEAADLDRRALELDPLSAAGYHNLGRVLHAADRLTESEQAFRKALELAPQRVLTHAELALALLDQGRGEEARAAAMSEPFEMIRCWVLAIVHHGLGHAAESEQALQEVIGRFAEGSASQIAEVYAIRGETDTAFAWLDRAYADREVGLLEIKSIPRFRALHGDPRWAALLRNMGFDVQPA